MSELNVLTIGEPGRAATEIGPRAPAHYPESADHELSECEVPGAQVRAASIRGLMHRYKRKPRQDRFSIVYDDTTSTLVITVCDGVGQFDLSQEAAGFVAADMPRAYLLHRDWHTAVAEVNQRLADFAGSALDRTRLCPAPADPRMATTLAAVAIRMEPEAKPVCSIAWTDDSSVWLLDGGVWEPLSDEDNEQDAELHSTKVRALPHTEPRLSVIERRLTGGALFVLTDGVGEPLKNARQVRETLAQWWAAPPDVFTFARQVGFARRTKVDDRTAVGVWFDPP